MKATAIIMAAFAIFNQSAHADGLPPPQAFPLPQPPQPSKSCLMTALQMGYLTGRREVAYANIEACIAFTRSRGVVLPYEWPRYYPPAGYGPPSPYLERKEWPMSAITLCVTILLALVTAASAQTTFRDASGRITGTVTTDSNGIKTFRDGSGRTTGTATRDSNGTTTFRDAGGRTTGTATAPRR